MSKATRPLITFTLAMLGAIGLIGCGPGQAPVSMEKPTATSVDSFTAHGWYYDPNGAGTGMMFEAQGARAFLGLFLYDTAGNPVWQSSSGSMSVNADGTYQFVGRLDSYSGGKPADAIANAGIFSVTPGFGSSVSIRFEREGSETVAKVTLPSGRVWVTRRFDFGGIQTENTASQPERGWYWNSSDSGRGYGIEVQGNQMFLTMFHYASDGRSSWNTVHGRFDGNSIEASDFTSYRNGQTLEGAYKAPTLGTSGGKFSITAKDPCYATVTLPGSGGTINIERYNVGSAPNGQQCRARSSSHFTKMAGVFDGRFSGADSGTLRFGTSNFGEVSAGSGNFPRLARGFLISAGAYINMASTFTMRIPTTDADYAFTGQFNSANCTIAGTWVRRPSATAETITGEGTFEVARTTGC